MALLDKLKQSGLVEFMKELYRNPGQIGAAFPSSKGLSRAMAAQVPLHEKGLVLELGAGTGVVTEALLQHGIAKDQLVVVERSVTLANHLQKRFPDIKVIQGDAGEITKFIDNNAPILAIVSSLPLRSLPPQLVQNISKEFDTLLKDGGKLIQFTYSWRQSHGHSSEHLRRIYTKKVWLNIPPARVEVFRYLTS